MHFREIPGLLSGGWMASVGVGGRPGSREASRVVMGDRQDPGSSALPLKRKYSLPSSSL